MPSGDIRKDFILASIGNHFSIEIKPADLWTNDKLNSFLDDGNTTLLAANVELLDNGGHNIHLDNSPHLGDADDKVLVFFKIKPDVITPENLHKDVLLSTMLESPVSALYHSLHKVYSPILLKDSKWSNEFDPKLQGLITELMKGLGSLMRRRDPKTHKSEEDSGDLIDAMASILTPLDETQYWADMANSPDTAKKRGQRERANAFWNALEPISDEFSKIENVQLSEADEILEVCKNSLDDLWKLEEFNYPQKRMVHLMDIIANSIIRFVQSKCVSIDLWKSPYNQVEEYLTQSIHLCEQWIDVCQSLTSYMWPNYPIHMWEGGAYKPDRAIQVLHRLKEVLSLRTLHKQLTQLLSLSEQEELKTEKSFEPFHGLNPVHYNPYTEPLWRGAVNQFESGLDPAENRIAGKLKKQCQNKNGNTLQFLQEFKRYKELIRRPSIQKSLVAERENLLGKLSEYVSSERKSFQATGPSYQLHEVPKTVNNVYFVRQLEAKIKDILKTGELLLSDLSSWPSLSSALREFLDEMVEYQREQYDTWCRDTLHDLETGTLSLKTGSQVIYFAEGKDMKVSYSPRLVGLFNEVRMLSVLGFVVPAKINQATDLAKRFAKQAKALEQIASFHNTIGDRMIASQRPMMLDAAVALSSMVKEQTDMTWENPDKIQVYIGKLRLHTEQLARQNNKLAAYHKEVTSKVMTLMGIDLLRQRSKWKEGIKEIRHIISKVEEDGFTGLKSWRNHWDRQLYKALEHQYQVGLEALNEHLQEIKVEVVYRDRRLQFRPQIEEIRNKYYFQLKRFLAIPNEFRGVSESSENLIFPAIIGRNASRFPRLFEKAEELFLRLEKVKNYYLDWVALGSVEVEDFIVENFKEAEDWERNFKAAKAKGQDIGRLKGGEEKVDCITVSFAPVRNEVETLNRKFWETLETSLKRSILSDLDTVEKFASEAIEMLRHQPQTVAEIGEANVRHKLFAEKMAPMWSLLDKGEKKNRVLAAWTKEQVDRFRHVASIWDNFQMQMDSHEAVVSKQVESIKLNLNSQVNNLNSDIEKFQLRWNSLKPKEEALDAGPERILQAISMIKEKRSEWDLLMETRNRLVDDNAHFGLKEPEFPLVDEVGTDLDKYEEMWGLFEEFNREISEMGKEEWIIFRSKSYRFEEFLTIKNDKLRASKQTNITVRLIHEIERYKVILPVLKYIRGEIFSEQHWAEMYSLLGMPQKTVETLKFEDFLKVKDRLVPNEVQLQELNNRAAGEVAIRQALSELDVWEVEAKFSFFTHQASSGEEVPLIKDWKDILNKVGDNQVLLQSIKGSPYYKTFGDRAVVWENKLADLDEILNNLNVAQRKWVYLEPYQEQMKFKKPAQTGGFDYREVFRKIDDDFRMIMMDAQRDNRIVALLRIGSIKSTLTTMLDRLERCQKSLNEFLEEKRSSFPRFYFIGDDDLLQILGQATKPAIIQTHLKKLFAGIYNVNFDDSNQHIISMNSIEGEIVPLKNPVKISSEVEGWLNDLAKEMQNTLRLLLIDCLRDGRSERIDMDPLKYPSQVLCLAEAILFTERAEEAIRKGSLNSYLKELKAQLESYTSVDFGGGDDEMRVLELKLKALILDTIHYIQVVEGLIESKVRSLDEWHWKKELRFYMSKDNVATISMVDAQFFYTYEYQGNAPKLVHTPLTDKCYLTLTQAMRVGLGGNPYGPAGTGKTESVKALGGILGRQVLVFNCDEGIDVKSMGRIFVGLIKCGAWGCFDEFNRLEEQTLSAVSMQIQPIQTALRKRSKTVLLMDKEVPLDPNTGIFVTMNPAGKKYGGRQKLPDNLKQLFRPVAMSKPDNEIIGEVSLYSEGFKDAKNLGQKLVGIFNLSMRLLSPQQHYDWGLRALKTVLKGCGSMLKMAKKGESDETKQKLSQIRESEIVVQALRLNTLSKLTFADSMRFDSLVKDVFTGIKFGDEGYADLKAALQESCVDLGFNHNPNQIKKAIELYEQLQQRMGVVIVGPSGSGKTTLFSLLKQALTKMGKTVKQHTMNPKAIPRTQLLGQIDLDTREWTNGVLTVAALEAVDQPVEVNTWIVCDGDIDPEWIESLNSVLDDNRLLTLPSGWRIQFGPNVNFLFETNDLTYASPATISRMGMIFLSDEDTDTEGIVKAWLDGQTEANKANLQKLLDEMFFRAIDWCLKANDFIVETSLVGCVLNGLSHMDGVSSRLEFGVALLRGLGSNLGEATKETFAKEVFGWCGSAPHGRRLMFTFYNKERDKLEPYTSEVDDRVSLSSFHTDNYPVVQTAAVKFTLDCVSTWLQPKTQQPFILVGPEGCGKSLLLNHCFKKLRSTNVAVVHCSAHITPLHVIQKLSQVCLVVSSSNGRVFRPKECDRLILYLKDLNLAMPDKYGTCMIVAFLQQLITYGGFYDGLEWVGLEAVLVVGSMSAGSGLGRHQLSTRLTSVVRIASMGHPDKEYLDALCTSYVTAALNEVLPNHPVWGGRGKAPQLAGSMVSVYVQMKQMFSVDDYNHYIFTTRDLTQWILNLVRYSINPEDKSPTALLVAWAYEACRLFRDKLAGRDDRQKFDTVIKNVLMTDWNSNAFDNMDSIYFTTAGDAGFSASAPMPRFGRNLAALSAQNWHEFVERGVQIFERENRDLEAVMIRELLDLVSRCDRVLSAPGGSLLLSGRSGVGRRTAVSIVAALHQAKLVALKMGKNFGTKQFKTELKATMQAAATEDGQVFLLLEDHNFIEPQFLDMINSLLSSGEIPGLYTSEELEPFIAPLRDRASNEGYSGNLISYFAQCVRKNLHIILIMDCSSSSFRERCESNPALFKKCSIQWLEFWSDDTMLKFPSLLLSQEPRIEGGNIGEKKSKKKVENDNIEFTRFFHQIHMTQHLEKASNHKFITFIKTYQDILSKKRESVLSRQQKLSKGVSKLQEAKEVVHRLKSEAAVQEKELDAKKSEADNALQMITDTMRNANNQKGQMEELRGKTLDEEKDLNRRKAAIDLEMEEIKPLIEEAKQAVGNIKSNTLSEIRSLRAPPDVIRDVLEGVLCLMGTQDLSWNSMKSFLAKRGVKEEILSFDARRINPESRRTVERLLQQRSNSFDPEVAKKASTAAAPLAIWVVANVKFSYVLEKIKPLEAEQSKLQRNLKMAEDQIGQLSSGLDEVDQQVAVLKERLNRFTKEAAEIEIHLSKTKETISAADSLVVGLEGEYKRWNKEVKSMEKDLEKIPHFSLLGAAFVTYLSSAPEDIRRKAMEHWSSLIGINSFELKRFLSSEREMLQWRSEGLPSDELSIENAMCILQSKPSPYLIDPSSRAVEWLKVHLGGGDKPIEVANPKDERFILTLELAVRFGKTLLLQDVQSIDPILYPILRRDLAGQGIYKVVQIGEKMVDFNPSFRLFLATRNTNVEIPPDASSIISSVNFTTTRAGMTSQLLATALKSEKPELEVRKSELLRVEEEHKIEIGRLEDFLLEELANATGNLLENKELLASLNETKAKSANISESLKESVALQDSILREGNVYLPVATFASDLFFTVVDLSKLNNMYRISLAAFMALFEKSLRKAPHGGTSSEKRISAIKQTLQDMVYDYISRGLFKSDRLTFAMHLAHGMYPEMFADNEWEMFSGMIVTTDTSDSGTSVAKWIPEERRVDVAKLKSIFPKLYENLQLEDQGLWSGFLQSEDASLPIQLSKTIKPFHQVLLTQALRPEKLLSGMEYFASKVLGLKELSPPGLSLRNMLQETQASEPILIIISSGSDPSEELRDLAQSMQKNLHEVAMGQGQSEIALEKLRSAAEKGEWLCLKNLHLMTFWLPILEKEFTSLNLHEGFRLWLTAEPHAKFSSTLAELCLKATYESPPGVKRNLQRTLQSWGTEVFSKGDNALRPRTIFALAWFHAVVQERRIFIPQGWCKFYEFSDSDLKAGLQVIDQLFSRDTSNIDWEFIHGLFANAIYGGRVDDVFDIQILQSYLEDMFNGDVISSSRRPLGPINLPPTGAGFREFIDLINQLSDEDRPAMFGLPANIQQAYQRTRSQATLQQLRVLMRSAEGATKFEREKWNSELTPILTLWKKLNQSSSLIQMKPPPPQRGSQAARDPVAAFVELEFSNGVGLIQMVHKSLSALTKVIRGTALVDEKVSRLADNIMKQTTPPSWQKVWEGPEEPAEYIKAIVCKANAVQHWKSLVDNGNILQRELDLSDLFNPDTFLGALRQQTAREHGVAMDALKFSNAWSKAGVASAKLPIRVSGLLIEGAVFDGSRLSESTAQSPTLSTVPLATFAWVLKTNHEHYQPSECVRLPVYHSDLREKILTFVDVPTSGDKKRWLQAGVVLFLKSQF